MTKYREPLLLNGCLSLLLGALGINLYFSKELSSIGPFLVGCWAFPFANFLLFIQRWDTGQPRLTLVYGVLTLVFFALAWSLWSYGMGAFTKIGG